MNSIFKIFYALFFIILAVMFIKFTLVLLLIVFVLLWLRTWQMKKEPNQALFSAGRLPNPKPEGFYQGSTGFETLWIGKKFEVENPAGVNVFKSKKKPFSAEAMAGKEKYHFKTHAGRALFDQHSLVLKIDYNVRGNPFWIRWILDEIVEVAPNHYLGKMHVRIIPGLPFSLLYFELKK